MTATDRLSPRQRECLRLYWESQATSKEIARALGIAKGTVDGYFAEAVAALGARDRRDAARIVFGSAPPPAVTAPPAESGADAAWVDPAPPWRSLLPLRQGASHNDLSIRTRLLWYVVGLVVAGVAFASFAGGVHLLNDVFR